MCGPKNVSPENMIEKSANNRLSARCGKKKRRLRREAFLKEKLPKRNLLRRKSPLGKLFRPRENWNRPRRVPHLKRRVF